jgi:fibronectin type 3 domain-containing protein
MLYAKWISATPSVPTLVKAVSSSYNSINISWNAATGATGYEIYRATSSAGTYTLIATPSAISYNNIGLITDNTYYYKVRAYRLVGTVKVYSDFSTIISAKPVLSVSAISVAARTSSTSIKLTWSGVTGASGYEVYRSTSSTGTYSLVKSTNTLNFINTGLKTGATYYYKVRSYRNVGTTKVYSEWRVVKNSRR